MFTYIKRFFLFGAVNLLVIATLQGLIRIAEGYFGISLGPYNVQMIFIYSILGMGGAFFALFTSKWSAKRSMGLQMLDPKTTQPTEKWLVDTVHTYAKKAGITTMPEVAIYPSQDINAFATGPSKNNSLVAVTTGLLNAMDKEEVEGVIGHEVAHIANGDMVTMTLMQGVVNSIVMIFSRIIADVVASKMEKGGYMARFAIQMVATVVLTLLGSILVKWFSRHREFRADYGGAKYAGKEKMISALQKLQAGYSHIGENQVEETASFASLKISGISRSSFFKKLFLTHPPLEERIRALKANSI